MFTFTSVVPLEALIYHGVAIATKGLSLVGIVALEDEEPRPDAHATMIGWMENEHANTDSWNNKQNYYKSKHL